VISGRFSNSHEYEMRAPMQNMPTAPMPCALCDVEETREVSSDSVPLVVNIFHLVRCVGCGLVRVDPAPTEEALARYYDAYAEYMTSGGRTVMSEDEALARADADIADLERWHSPGTLLDIGCGGGHVMRAAAGRGWDAFGTEAGELAVKALRSAFGAGRVGTDDEPPTAGPPAYDAVVLRHVLEHLRDPAAALGRALEMVTPGGVLVCEVPDINALRIRFRGHPLMGQLHLWHFGATTLTAFLARRGFTVNELCFRDHRAAVGSAARGLARRIRFGAENVVWRLARLDIGTNLRAFARPAG
jgi:SAM-dependent methyltransferase